MGQLPATRRKPSLEFLYEVCSQGLITWRKPKSNGWLEGVVFICWHCLLPMTCCPLTWGFESEAGRVASAGPRHRPWCSLCCQSAWTRSAAHPWLAGRAAGADAPGMSWMTAERDRRQKEARLKCELPFVRCSLSIKASVAAATSIVLKIDNHWWRNQKQQMAKTP